MYFVQILQIGCRICRHRVSLRYQNIWISRIRASEIGFRQIPPCHYKSQILSFHIMSSEIVIVLGILVAAFLASLNRVFDTYNRLVKSAIRLTSIHARSVEPSRP